MMPAKPYHSPIPPQLWDAVREEFGLPGLGQVRERLEAGSPNPEPAFRQLVRVFLSGLLRLALLFTAVGLGHPLPVVTPQTSYPGECNVW